MPARGRRFPSSTRGHSALAAEPQRYSPEHGMLASGSLETYFPRQNRTDPGDFVLGEDAFVIAGYLSSGLSAVSTATEGANFSGVPTTSRNSTCSFGDSFADWVPGFYAAFAPTEGLKIVAKIGQLREQEYDDEPEPSEDVIDKISALIRDADELMPGSMPEGTVSTFYGEVNVTWRRNSNIVRLACFSNRPAMLQFGNLSQPLDPYQSIAAPSAENVAHHLSALMRPQR